MKVLIIEDEEDISLFVKKGLEAQFHTVDSASDGEEGARLALQNAYDIILLDINLPKLNGVEVARRIRQSKKSMSIIVLTIEPDVNTKVEMLSLCDDYVTKPFSLEELIARIQAVGRRGKVVADNILEVGDLRMDLKRLQVTRSGKIIELRNKEFALLEYFMRNPGVVLVRGMILENVWDMNVDPFTNTVNVHVRLLREKINKGFKRKLINTLPKRGYQLSEK